MFQLCMIPRRRWKSHSVWNLPLAQTYNQDPGNCKDLRFGWLSFASNSGCALGQSADCVQVSRPFPLSRVEKLVIDFFLQVQQQNPADLKDLEYRLAGGWVRDKLLGCPEFLQKFASSPNSLHPTAPLRPGDPSEEDPGDLDIALNTLTGSQLLPYVTSSLETFGDRPGKSYVVKANPAQSKHLETVQVDVFGCSVDLVNLRKESYASDSRIPTMEIGTPVSDVTRRDFTLNAIFYHLQRDVVEDWLGGRCLQDLADGVLDTPSVDSRQTLLDDPLRALRALRFSARFGFSLGQSLLSALRDPEVATGLASKVSRPRIRAEIWKTLLHFREDTSPPSVDVVSAGRGRGLVQWLEDLDLVDVVFPALGSPSWAEGSLEQGSRMAQQYRKFRHSLRYTVPGPDGHNTNSQAVDSFKLLLESVGHEIPSSYSSLLALAFSAAGESVPDPKKPIPEGGTNRQVIQELVCLYQSYFRHALCVGERFNLSALLNQSSAKSSAEFYSSALDGNSSKLCHLWIPARLGNMVPRLIARDWKRCLVQENVLLTSKEFQEFLNLGFGGVLAHELLYPTTFSLGDVNPLLKHRQREISQTYLAVIFYSLVGPSLSLPALLQGALSHQLYQASTPSQELTPSTFCPLASRIIAETSNVARAVFVNSPHLLKPSPGHSPQPSLTEWILSHSRLRVQGRMISFYVDFMTLSLCSGVTAVQHLYAFIHQSAQPAGPIATYQSARDNALAKLDVHTVRLLSREAKLPTNQEWLKILEEVLEALLAGK